MHGESDRAYMLHGTTRLVPQSCMHGKKWLTGNVPHSKPLIFYVNKSIAKRSSEDFSVGLDLCNASSRSAVERFQHK